MIGVEVVSDKAKRTPAKDEALVTIMNEAASRGVLVGRGGLFYNRIRFQPPLVITEEQADKALDVFEQAVKIAERKC
jgi:4-aminobutyrate aminotransferase-like enzyme